MLVFFVCLFLFFVFVFVFVFLRCASEVQGFFKFRFYHTSLVKEILLSELMVGAKQG